VDPSNYTKSTIFFLRFSIKNETRDFILLHKDTKRRSTTNLNPKQFGYFIQSMFRVKIERQKNIKKIKGGQRDLTGEDGSLANTEGAEQEDSRSRLQISLHGPAPKSCTLTPDQKLSGFGVPRCRVGTGKSGDATRV
jgi:hypothetical protein